MAINKPKEEKIPAPRKPANEVISKFMVENGIAIGVENDPTVKIVSDGSIIIGAPTVKFVYKDGQ